MPVDPESPWRCVCCNRRIDERNGISLTDDLTWQVCNLCWSELTRDQQLSQARAWRAAKAGNQCLQALTDLCTSAQCSSALSRLGDPPGRN